MNINFAMWRKALAELIKMDDKKEWNSLDVVSKWLIATRSAVTSVTLYSCAIAGLLAWRDGVFAWLPWIILTLGLFIAHGTNNLLNDYTDFSRGVDKDNYFRTQYGVHPLVQNFWTKSQQIQWFIVSGIIAFLSGVFALFYTGFQLNRHRPVRFRCLAPAFLHLAAQILGAGRTGNFPRLGTDHDRRRLFRARGWQKRRFLQPVERCSGGRSLWVKRGQHQFLQTHRQTKR